MIYTPNTPRQMLESFMTLTVWCKNCRHSHELDLTKLPQDREIKSLKFHCTKCHTRDYSFIVGVNHPAMMNARRN